MKKKNRAVLSIAVLTIIGVAIMSLLLLTFPLQAQTPNPQKLATQAAQATQQAQATHQVIQQNAYATLTQVALNPPAPSCLEINNFQFSHTDSNSGNWIFSWDTVAGEIGAKFQYAGGGLTDVWISPTQQSVERSGGKTKLGISPISFVAGKSFSFRLKVQTAAGETCWDELFMNSIPS